MLQLSRTSQFADIAKITAQIAGDRFDAATKKICIQILPPPREAPHDNLRAGVVNANSKEMIAAILDGNDISISR
jgi:hypothetical protein